MGLGTRTLNSIQFSVSICSRNLTDVLIGWTFKKINLERFGDFLNLKKKNRTKLKLSIIRSKRFHIPRLRIKQNENFYNCF